MSIEYYMDNCSEWEINDIVENIPFLDRNMWESARLETYVVAQVNSRKKLQLQDICKFKWEDTSAMGDMMENKPKDVEITNEDIERLKNLAKQWERK